MDGRGSPVLFSPVLFFDQRKNLTSQIWPGSPRHSFKRPSDSLGEIDLKSDRSDGKHLGSLGGDSSTRQQVNIGEDVSTFQGHIRRHFRKSESVKCCFSKCRFSEDFSLLVAFLLVTFSWLFVALFCLEKQCSGLFRYFFVVFSWLFRGFFVAPVLGKIYAYSPWNSLLSFSADREKSEKYSRWGTVLKITKSLGPTFSLCRRAGTDAALVKVQSSFRKCTSHRK